MAKSSSIAVLAVCLGCSAPEGPEALMTAGDVRTMPWPSDGLRINSKLQVKAPFPFDGNPDNLDRLAQALSELDGFGTVTSIFFPLSGDVTVEAGATAILFDLLGAPPTQIPLLYRKETKQLVAILPTGTVLHEHHRYACVIRDGVKLHASPAMQQLIDSTPGLGGARAATVFTTRSVSDWVVGALGRLDAAPKAHVTRDFTGADLDTLFGGPVTTTRPGLPPSGGVLHDQVGRAIEGTFSSPNFLSNPPGALGFYDGTVKSTDNIPFLLVLPAQAPPGNTYPVLMFQHGIGSDRSAMLLVANDYAAHGYATFGIDELWHGSRQPGAADEKNNISGDPVPDGIGDPGGLAVANFFDFTGDNVQGIAALDPRIMRDNFRQAAIDLMQAVRLAKHGDWSEAAVALDGTLVYSGESFGSILGAMVMALDPEVPAGVLDVGGGGLFLDLVGNSASFAQLLQPFVAGGFDQLVDVNHPDVLPVRAQMSLNLMQTLMEPGDGLSLSQVASIDKQVLFLEAYNDEVVANHSTEALANAWGCKQVMLASGSPPTRVVKLDQVQAPAQLAHALVQLDPACHGMYTRQKDERKFEDGFPPFVKRDLPLAVDNPIERAHALALGWIDSYRHDSVGTVPLVP